MSEPMARRAAISGWTLVGFWAFCTTVGLIVAPDPIGHGTHQKLLLMPCPVAAFLGRPCPGCGLTTSWCALLHGNFDLAFRAHAFGPIAYLCLTIGALWYMVALLKKQAAPIDVPWVRTFMRSFATVFLVYAVGRAALVTYKPTPMESIFRVANR